ncbi:MAG: energy-coupling factor transporter ATPase [Enorma sp.]|uniref:ABC transporter ATP-binding protein n=1 Tax=Enorma sp. TaxID=1920692 RepID=UPI0025910A25|nr:energy-coupling factor transporter ATPase [Enorma sp.]MCI7775267.1 energy-coupling factor transporter ATPase [Enorma sp.]
MQNHSSTTAAGSIADPIIELHDVHFSYAGADEEALRGATLSVAAGEHLCILGSNGSGKSTLAQLINALLAPTDGSARVCGIDAAAQPERALELRRQVAMVFQHPDDQMVTSVVADDVAFGPENLGVPQPQIAARVDDALAAVSMLDHAQADPADLSGGQRQRIAIAGALAMHPRVLVLDEPAAMLDVAGRRAIQCIARGLNEQGITIVHITHFMDDALVAGRVAVMDKGRIALEGTPEEVFAQRDVIHSLGLELPFTLQLAHRLEAVLPELPAVGDAEELARAIACAAAAGTPARSGALRATANTPARSGDIHAFGSDRSPENKHLSPEREQKGQTAAQNSAQTAAIEFRDVTFSYAEEQNARKRLGLLARLRKRRGHHAPPHVLCGPLALDSVSFTIPAGSLTALIGHTGSGKSTTVELACALKVPNAGTVRVNDIDTTDLSRRSELRSQVGYVAQLPERQLFAQTVFDDIAFGPRNLALSDAEVSDRVNEALARVGLAATPELLGRSPFAVSGGQQRAVAIAGVLAMRTPILVLDEPMAGLDPAGQRRMRKLIARLKREGRTILVVTHNMDDVAELADHVIALEHGHLAAAGAPRQVFAQAARHVPGMPAALAFSQRLEELGMPLDSNPLTLDELVDCLIERLGRAFPEEVCHGRSH